MPVARCGVFCDNVLEGAFGPNECLDELSSDLVVRICERID